MADYIAALDRLAASLRKSDPAPNYDNSEDEMVGKKSGKALLREEGTKHSLLNQSTLTDWKLSQAFNELTMA